MLDLSFFTTLKLGWLNAWIPAFGMVLIQFVYMALFPETGKGLSLSQVHQLHQLQHFKLAVCPVQHEGGCLGSLRLLEKGVVMRFHTFDYMWWAAKQAI